MEEMIFTPEELIKMGFIFNYRFPFEEGGHYEVYEFKKNESEIEVTYEYNQNGTFNNGCIEFNGSVLKGRAITAKDVELLKELM